MAILEKKAIGLDIYPDVVRVVELAQGRKGLRLIGFSSKMIERKEGEEEKESVSRTLKELFQEKKIKGERIVSALPLTSAVVRNITFPFQDAGKIEKAVKFEAEPYLPFAVEEVIIDFHITGEAKGNGAEVLIIAVDKKRIREHLNILSGAGIEPTIVSLDTIAIFNAYSLIGEGRKEKTVALVDIGVEKTTVAVVSEGNLSFIRGIPQGNKDLAAALAKEERMVPLPILKEIQRTFISSQARLGKEIEEIVLSGEGSQIPTLREHLSRELGIGVSVYDLTQKIEHSLDEMLLSSSCVGVGLALEGLGQGKLSFNFRKEEFALRFNRARIKKSLILPFVLSGGIVCLSLFGLFMNLHLRERGYQALNEKVEEMFQEVFPEGRVVRGMELELLRRKVEEEKGQGQALENLAQQRFSSLEMIRELFLRVPEGKGVQLFSLRLRSDLLKIEGEVASFGAIDLLTRELKGSPYFQKVSLTQALASSDGKAVRFAMDIYLVR
jgi:Tfp pilus assembly PilM family ATPase